MPITCCVYQCHNRQGKHNTRFFSFPKDQERKSKWIAAIRRDKWQPSKYSKVCSDHFKY
uniref:THAP-type domain-containing protein n=1 Tax=Amphimedon queenslandica TaxID=400682 RepID=A0A1X7SG23_AMPQE